MDIRAFEYVNAIIEHGSMSKASKALFISQPALSQYISKLERSLGVNLFLRENGLLTLTPQGRVFVQNGKQILTLYSAMSHALASDQDRKKEVIRLGVSHFYSQYTLPPVLPGFLQTHPNVDLHITELLTADIEEAILKDEVDLCILPDSVHRSGLDYHKLFQEEILIAVPAESSVTQNALTIDSEAYLDLSLLKDEPFITLSNKQFITSLCSEFCIQSGFEPNVICQVFNWNTLDMLVSEGLGVGFVSSVISDVHVNRTKYPLYFKIHGSFDTHRWINIIKKSGHVLSSSEADLMDSFINAFKKQ